MIDSLVSGKLIKDKDMEKAKGGEHYKTTGNTVLPVENKTKTLKEQCVAIGCCYTAQEIAEVVGVAKRTIEEEIEVYAEMEAGSKTAQSANFQDDFEIPI